MTPARTALAAAALLTVASPASAGPVNAGFEAGDFTGWTTTGDALVVSSAIGVTPTQGTYQAFLTTASQNGDLNNFSGTDAVSAAGLRTFLGLSGSDLPSAVEGSAIRQTFTANAGDVLTFDYKFLTTEAGNNDFAFVTLSGVGTLADTTTGPFSPSAVNLDPIFGDPTSETPWRTFSFTIPTTGTYTLGIGIADAGDEFIPSGLLIDNGVLTPAGPSGNPVPAPPSLVVMLLGVASLGIARTRTGRSRGNRAGLPRSSAKPLPTS
jgi:hypothetical protein